MTTTRIDAYKTHLESEDRSPLTVTGYLADARLFIAWFEQRNRVVAELGHLKMRISTPPGFISKQASAIGKAQERIWRER